MPSPLDFIDQQVGPARVLILPCHHLPLVHFMVVKKGGALADPKGAGGLLRFSAELLLRGTESKDRLAFSAALENLGSSIGAAVGSESASWQGACLARHLAPTLEHLAEALCTPRFDAEELAHLQDEVSDNLRIAREDDDALADYFWRKQFYAGHPLARSPGGQPGDIRSLSQQALAACHRAWDLRDFTFAFAGDLQPDEILAWVEKLVAAWPGRPAGKAAPAPAPFVEPEGQRLTLVHKPGRTQAQIRVGSLGPAGSAPAVEAFWLGVTAFCGTFTSPYTQEIRDQRGWSYVAHGDFRRRAQLPNPVVLRAAPASADAIPCLTLSLQMYGAFSRGEITKQALQDARDYVLARYPFEVASVYDKLSPSLGYHLLGFPFNHGEGFPERLAALDLSSVAPTVANHLQPQAACALIVGDKDQLLGPLQKAFPKQPLQVVDFCSDLDLD